MGKPIIQRRQINKVKVSLTFDRLSEMSTIDSKTIADVFEKNHKNIMRDIRDFPDFESRIGRLKIEPSYYVNEQNKKQPMFILDKSTATILILGFTGKKAHKFKVALLETFDKLEKKVSDLQAKEIERLNKQLSRAKGFNELNDKGLLKDKITASYGRASNTEYSKLGGQYVKLMESVSNGLFPFSYFADTLAEIAFKIYKLKLTEIQKRSWAMLQEKYN